MLIKVFKINRHTNRFPSEPIRPQTYCPNTNEYYCKGLEFYLFFISDMYYNINQSHIMGNLFKVTTIYYNLEKDENKIHSHGLTIFAF